MSYNSTTKIITAAVSIDDLKRCFQVVLSKTVSGTEQRGYSCDLGTIVKTETGDTVDGWTVRSRNNINKWAKFKPVRQTASGTNDRVVDTTGQRKAASGSAPARWKTRSENGSNTWWQGPDGMCGLTIPYFVSDLQAFLKAYFNNVGTWEWSYTKPGTGDMARMLDLVGYRHNAQPPIHHFMTDKSVYFAVTGQNVSGDSQLEVSIGYNVVDNNDGASLALGDFVGLSGYYFGVIILSRPIIRSGTGDNQIIVWHGIKTASNPIGGLGSTQILIDFGNNGLPTGDADYYAVGFLTKSKISTYTKYATPPTLSDIRSIGLPAFEFSTVGSGPWIDLEFVSVGNYKTNPVSVTLRFKTYRVRGQGNYNSGNSVRVYLATIKGKFGSSGPGIDDDQLGEPVKYFPNDLEGYVDIACRQDSSSSASYTDKTFTLVNESGTGAIEFPLRSVVATAEVYHSGDLAPDGSWNNTSATKEVGTAYAQLPAPSE